MEVVMQTDFSVAASRTTGIEHTQIETRSAHQAEIPSIGKAASMESRIVSFPTPDYSALRTSAGGSIVGFARTTAQKTQEFALQRSPLINASGKEAPIFSTSQREASKMARDVQTATLRALKFEGPQPPPQLAAKKFEGLSPAQFGISSLFSSIY